VRATLAAAVLTVLGAAACAPPAAARALEVARTPTRTPTAAPAPTRILAGQVIRKPARRRVPVIAIDLMNLDGTWRRSLRRAAASWNHQDAVLLRPGPDCGPSFDLCVSVRVEKIADEDTDAYTDTWGPESDGADIVFDRHSWALAHDAAYRQGVACHELGHVLGFTHTDPGCMNDGDEPFRELPGRVNLSRLDRDGWSRAIYTSD